MLFSVATILPLSPKGELRLLLNNLFVYRFKFEVVKNETFNFLIRLNLLHGSPLGAEGLLMNNTFFKLNSVHTVFNTIVVDGRFNSIFCQNGTVNFYRGKI